MTDEYRIEGHTTTIGPVDKHRQLVEALEEFSKIVVSHEPPTTQREALRKLAWFLGDKGEQAAAEAIMKHAKVVEQDWAWTPWGYMPRSV